MPHIFAGADRQQIDPEVLEAFKALPDNFWVFAEFTISRNIDWFVIHPHADGTLALIVIELKRTGLPLAGDINNAWKQWTPEGWRDLVLGGPYRNYYWQAVEAANKLKEWLWNNQRRFRLGQDLLAQDAFRIWPDLLILSPHGTNHQLPLQPPNNFGKFIFTLDDCLRHVTTWKSRQLSLVPLVDDELLRLAEALGLERIWPPAGQRHAERQQQEGLLDRIQALEERVRHLEAARGQAATSPSPPPQRDRIVASSAPPEWISPDALPALEPTWTVAPESPTNGQLDHVTGSMDGSAEASAPSLETVFTWVVDYLRAHGQGQPLRLTELGNGLKKRHNFNARLQSSLSLAKLLQQLEGTGRIRLSSRDRIPYASLPGDGLPPDHEQVGGATSEAIGPQPPETPEEAKVEPIAVRQKLGRDGLTLAVQTIAAVEDLAGGRVVKTGSFLKHLRESLPLNGVAMLRTSEANRLLREEFVALGYVRMVTVRDIDLTTGGLYTTEGYRLDREHPTVQMMLAMGTPKLNREIEVFTFATILEEATVAD